MLGEREKLFTFYVGNCEEPIRFARDELNMKGEIFTPYRTE